MSEVAEVLKAAREKISDPARWTQGAYARTVRGEEVAWDDKCASSWCARGAINSTTSDFLLMRKTRIALSSMTEPWIGVVGFNDTHTHEEVLALFDKAIANAEAL